MAIVLPILSTFNNTGIKQATASLGGFGKNLKGIGIAAAGAAAGLTALNGAVNFAGDAIAAARDLERNMASVKTVFGESSAEMVTFIKNGKDMGLSQVETARTVTYLGSVLKQAGFEMSDVQTKTKDLTSLAQDLATTFGYDTSEALTAMTALFRGEYDPIEKFGVALKQQEVNTLLAAKGMDKLTGQALLNAQQQVRLEQLFLRSADAMGSFERGAGTLFVEQKKLTASFADMQATVGGSLTPVLADLMMALTPIVDQATPVLVKLFDQLGLIMRDLTPVIKPVADIFFSLIQILTSVFTALEPLFKLLGVLTGETLALLGRLLQIVADAFTWLGDIINDVFEQFNKFDGGPVTAFLDDMRKSIERLLPFLQPLGDIWENTVAKMTQPDMTKQRQTETNDYLAFLNKRRLQGVAETLAAATVTPDPGKKEEVKDAVKEFFANLEQEMKQNIARIKLKRLGASEGLIDSIVGTGDDWQKVFDRIMKSGEAGVKAIQKKFNQTATGIAEVKKAQEELKKIAEAAAEAEKELADAAKKAADELAETQRQQLQAFEELKQEIMSLATAVKPMGIAIREIGQYEQAAVDSINALTEAIRAQIKSGAFDQAAESLIAYADKEKTVLAELGRQRDVIANKRSLAEALFKDVKSAIVGIANINDRVKEQSEKVTETVTRMVGNLTVSTSRTIEVIAQSETIASTLSKTLDKTRKFALQLKELRKLGLDQNLFKQIVDAGVDAGSVTAAEIIAGGAGTVSELNTLFADLNSIGADIAKDTADVMYEAGMNITTGLADGLIAQENELIKAAELLANSFITTFNSMMAKMTIPTANLATPTINTVTPSAVTTAQVQSQLESYFVQGGASRNEALAFGRTQTAQSIVLNVTAGVGTNGKAVGQAILAEINKYERANV
jgi:hypothetical protein